MATQSHHRVISLKLQRKRYPAELVERYILYRGVKLTITDEMFVELLSLLPEVWNTDKDRLTQFVLFEDSTYMCVRNKDIYNFSRKETEDKTYFYNAATEQQVANIVKILTDFFGKKKLEEVGDFYDSVMASLSDMSYMKKRLLKMREEALYRSDYMFNSDYSFSDAETEQKWKTYRQEWRDITSSESWVNNDFVNLQIPVAPKAFETFEIVLMELKENMSSVEVTDKFLDELKVNFDCAEYEYLANNFGELSFKLEILKTLNKLKIPFNTNVGGGDVIDEIEDSLSQISLLPMDVYTRYKDKQEIEDSGNEYTMKGLLDEQITNIDLKIEAINAKLAEYNLDYTISDIMTKYIEDTKLKAEDIEREEQAEKLVYELSGGEEA